MTQIMSMTFMICVLSRTLSLTFPMHCNKLNSIGATETGLSRTSHGLCGRHLDMVCVHYFRDLCPRLSPQESFGESRHNVIWALPCIRAVAPTCQ